MTPTYRPDIDGLRAIAVLAVLFFHLGFGGFSGGYVGVDVFFVISGYLITIIIVREIDAGTFSLSSFYERRFRRILPAAVVVALFCLLLGNVLFTSADYVELARSVISNGFFVSNFYFYSVTGYFDGPAELKPLLHTWSLAVEEQFYLFFPLLLLAIARHAGKRYLAWLLPVTIASLVACIVATPIYPAGAFFLLPTRAWELAIGALLVLLPIPVISSAVVQNLVAGLGLCLIAVGVFFFDNTTPFPGVYALVPVIGSALVIQAGKKGDFLVKRFLSVKPLVFIGLVSYSLYLWHWPLYVFAKRLYLTELDAGARLTLVALSFLLATISWRFIEMPFRSRQRFRGASRVFAASFAAMALVVGVSLAIVLVHGLPENAHFQHPARLVERDVEWERWTACELEQYSPGIGHAPCQLGLRSANTSFLLWGDSHAMALASAVNKSAAEAGRGGVLAVRSACLPILGVGRPAQERCEEFNLVMLRTLQKMPQMDTVILAGRWNLAAKGSRYKDEEGGPVELVDFTRPGTGNDNPRLLEIGLRRTVEALQLAGKRVVLVDSVPEIGYDVPAALEVAKRTGRDLNDLIAPKFHEFESRNQEAAQIIERLKQRYGIQEIEPAAHLCDNVSCRVLGETGKPYYRDDDHLSTYGSRELSPAFDVMFRRSPTE